MENDDDSEKPGPAQSWGGGPRRKVVVPAKTLYVPAVGDSVHTLGKPDDLHADVDGDWYGSPLFIVPKGIPFGPLIQRRFVWISDFSDADWGRLEELLGAKVPEDCRELIDAACELFVNSVALQKQIATWKQLRELLEKIVPAGRTLLEALKGAELTAPDGGALSAIQTIGTYIALELPNAPYGLDRFLPDLASFVSFAESALPVTQNGPGTVAQAELRLFLIVLVDVAVALAVPTKLLGHDRFAKVDLEDETAPAERTPPAFFRFVREVLRLAHIYGAAGISGTALPQDEKAAALKTLDDYTKKDDKALSKQLERIITSRHTV